MIPLADLRKKKGSPKVSRNNGGSPSKPAPKAAGAPGKGTDPPRSYARKRLAAEVLALAAHYSGSAPEAGGGARGIFPCPSCGERRLEADTGSLTAGCANPECPVPAAADAVALVSHFEGLDPMDDFMEILERGYAAAGIEPGSPAPRPDAPRGARNLAREKDPPTGQREDAPGPLPEAVEAPTRERKAAAKTLRTPPESPAPTDITTQTPLFTDEPEEDSTEGDPPREADAREEAARTEAAPAPDRRPGVAGGTARGPTEHQLDLADRVYRSVMAVCELSKGHHEFLIARGFTPRTIAEARLGSISKRRCSQLVRRLKKEFTKPELHSVPGFTRKGPGEVSFTFHGDYILIPHHDGRGRISTIEGRVPSDKPATAAEKYLSPEGSSDHVYLYPGTDPNDLRAFCEGPLGAIAAAQEGVAVGAVAGPGRHRGLPRFEGDERAPPEVDGADFGGRQVPYVPDAGAPPRRDVLEKAPEAARVLAALQNGRPATARPPRGEDLEGYVLRMNEAARRPALEKLIAEAHPTSTTAAAAGNPPAAYLASTGRTRPSQAQERGDELIPGPWPDHETPPQGAPAPGNQRGEDPRPPARAIFYAQPLPPDNLLLGREALAGAWAFAIVWGMLTALAALAHFALRYLAAAAWMPLVLARAAARLADPSHLIAAALLTALVAALCGALLAYRESATRRDRRRMLKGEVRW